MPIDVTMPKLSDTMEEGKILRWMKRPGDRVAIGEIIAEVETDKANMELEAYDEGVLSELRLAEGESAPVGAVIAVLAEPGEAKAPPAGKKTAAAKQPAPEKGAPEKPAPPAEKRAAAKPEPAREPWRPTVVRRPAPEDEHVKASPLARRIARDRDLDLRTVSGSGPGGRIVEKDVEAALAGRAQPSAEPKPAPAAPRGAPAPAPAGRVELSRIRRTTAKRMGEAKREIPHFYATAEIAMDEAVRLKEALVGLGGEYDGLTYPHLLVKAVGLALRRVPELNASYDGDAMVLHEAVNVGVATAVDDGLVVPVIRNCDREPLAAIVRQARGLLERARSGRFGGEDLSGGTFTVSNLGMYPVSEFAAVINPPQAAILAVGTIRETPVVRDGQVVVGRMMSVTVSCDHRIIDGVLAGRFLRELKGLLENPLALVL
jgi:pyruvate dehydrogenase E2 component (dihydrolipoamide acetyltransferase)